MLHDVLFEDASGRFGLRPIGELLQTDAPGAFHSLAVGTLAIPFPAMQGLLHAVKTGEPAFDHVFGSSLFEHLAENPHESERFERFMGTITERVAISALSVYDFSRFRTLFDIGGGNGTFLTQILRAYPGMHGTLVELPSVAARAANRVEAADLAGRFAVVAGSFFESVPAGGDAYMLSWILHDWNDDQCIRILGNCRRAMDVESRLLIVEHLMGDRTMDDPAAVARDLDMLILTPGRERTIDEYHALISAAGLTVTSVTHVPSPLGGKARTVIEAIPT